MSLPRGERTERVQSRESEGMRENESGEGRADRTDEAREEGDRERRLRQLGTACVEEREASWFERGGE